MTNFYFQQYILSLNPEALPRIVLSLLLLLGISFLLIFGGSLLVNQDCIRSKALFNLNLKTTILLKHNKWL